MGPPGFSSAQQTSAHELAMLGTLDFLQQRFEQASFAAGLALREPFLDLGRGLVGEAPILAPVAHQESPEVRGKDVFAEQRFLSTDERSRGLQQESCPRASRARQMQPTASKVAAYLSRVVRVWWRHAFPSLRSGLQEFTRGAVGAVNWRR
jgi:hypothetical protein